jgi:uncharacterized protein (TIGR00369 family)
MLDPWQEPVRGGYLGPDMLLLPGFEQLRQLVDDERPQPPISRLTGMELTEVDEGRATFELPLTDWLLSSQGAIPIGPLLMPADAAMACAIQTVLPARSPITTWELSLQLLAPARPGSRLSVRGRLIMARARIGLAQASLTDEHETLIAHGTTLCLMQPVSDQQMSLAPALPDDPDPPDGSPDPWQRPAIGEVLGQEVWEQLPGLEVLRAQIAGELPAPPLHHLLGVSLRDASVGSARFEMPASEWLCAPARGRVQGGAVALLAEAALSSAIQTTLQAGSALAPIDVKINYLRPLAADGRLAVAAGEVVHAGRSLAVANATVLDAGGRKVAVATGSAMLLADRPASLGAADG